MRETVAGLAGPGAAISPREVHALQRLSELVRWDVVETLGVMGTGHPGPSLSPVEIMVTLYFREMRIDPARPKWPDRDRFVLSKGHGALGFYAVLSRRGFFPREELFTFECLGSRLQGHPDTVLTPGVELSTGSLGQGLSFSAGVAIAAKMRGSDIRSYCLLGEGETEEGNIWEAAMASAKYKLDNLVAIVDWNGLQGEPTLEVMPSLEPYGAKWEAFGWHVLDVPGHDVASLLHAFAQARAVRDRPTVIVARTIKGKGVSFMENEPDWHNKKLEGAQLEQAKREVQARLAALEEREP